MTKSAAPVSPNKNLGPHPRYQIVPVDAIFVDSSYQRPVVPAIVNKIVSEFRWEHFGTLSLREHPDGRFAITDGQNRWTAAKLHPMVLEVPAMVAEGYGVRLEAQDFLAINRDRKAVTTLEKFWAGVAAEDPDYLRIKEVVERAGCMIAGETGGRRPSEVSAITALDRALKNYGDSALVRALTVIRATWPTEDKAMRGTMITALARLFRHNPDMDTERLRGALKGKSITEMTSHAEGFRKLSGGSAESALARTVTEIYNRGLSKNIIHYAG